jgi:hypothetical protein
MWTLLQCSTNGGKNHQPGDKFSPKHPYVLRVLLIEKRILPGIIVVDKCLFCLFWRMVHEVAPDTTDADVHALCTKPAVLKMKESGKSSRNHRTVRGTTETCRHQVNERSAWLPQVQWKSTNSLTFSIFTIKKKRNPFFVKVNQFMVHKSYTLNLCLEEWFINLLIHAYQYKILLRLFHHFSFHSCCSYWILV